MSERKTHAKTNERRLSIAKQIVRCPTSNSGLGSLLRVANDSFRAMNSYSAMTGVGYQESLSSRIFVKLNGSYIA